MLLEAFARLRAGAHLVIAGDGPRRADARSAGRTRWAWPGGRTSSACAMTCDPCSPHVDVAAISSDFEGTPLFALECMAARTPLVATAVGGLPALLGDAAVLVPPRDPAALAAGIDRLLGDPGCAPPSPTRRSSGRDRYEIGAVAERFGALYMDLLERRCSRS